MPEKRLFHNFWTGNHISTDAETRALLRGRVPQETQSVPELADIADRTGPEMTVTRPENP